MTKNTIRLTNWLCLQCVYWLLSVAKPTTMMLCSDILISWHYISCSLFDYFRPGGYVLPTVICLSVCLSFCTVVSIPPRSLGPIPLRALPFHLFSLPFSPFPPFPLFHPIRSRTLKYLLKGLGSAVNSQLGSGAEHQPTNDLVHFSLKIWHLVATILITFLSDFSPCFFVGTSCARPE